MKFTFLPEPKKIRIHKGYFTLPNKATTSISSHELFAVAKQAASFLKHSEIHISIPSITDALEISICGKLHRGGYRIRVCSRNIVLEAECVEAAFHGVQTLRQLIEQSDSGELPILTIDDWPDFEERGVYYDVCRGRVPKLEQLMDLAKNLSRFKINQLQLYIEHTFRFRNHADIGKGASPLSAEDIMQLDSYCADHFIELIPSLATFGHLATVLKHPQYHHLTEDWAKKKYVDPEADKIVLERYLPAWSLSPAVPEVYDFLDSLFAEFLPLFRSDVFNLCCDETYDIGLGRSYEMARKIGKGRLYLNHILKLRELAGKYGKRIMLWGDIIRQYPELVEEIPGDVTILDWGYDYDHSFNKIRDFKKSGLDFYACPGTSSWVSLFPRIHEASANIAGFAAAGKRNKSKGLLNTDWGDGGHYNFMEYSWYGYLFGAEQSWNVRSDKDSFGKRFADVFMKIDSDDFSDALMKLGDITHLKVGKYYQSVWQHIFFACPDDDILQLPAVNGWVSENGNISTAQVNLDSEFGKATLSRLGEIRKTLNYYKSNRCADPLGILPYWIFAVDTISHAARKLVVLGPSGTGTLSERRKLKKEMEFLLVRFESLWLKHNRNSEIRITRKRYQKVIKSL